MTSGPEPPPMSHSGAYYEQRHSPRSAHPLYQYPPNPQLPRPSPAYHSPNNRGPVASHRTDPNRVQSSVSSGDSASTVASDFKAIPPQQVYNHSPQAERGVVAQDDPRRSYFGSHSHASTQPPVGGHGQSEMIEDQSAVFRYIQQQQAEDEADKEDDHALWILMWMSFLDPFYCFFSAIFSIFALFILIALLPLRLCRKESSSSTVLIRMVGPVFRNHLQMIDAKSLTSAHTFEFSPSCLVFINVVSPVISMGNAVAAWVVAVFWVFAIIMGNPDGTEKRDDGRATVLMLRDWWERCLLYAIRK